MIAISFLIKSSSDFKGMRTAVKSWTSLILGQMGYSHESYLPFSLPLTCNGENVVPLIETSFLIGSSANLQILRTCIESRTNSIWAQFGLLA